MHIYTLGCFPASSVPGSSAAICLVGTLATHILILRMSSLLPAYVCVFVVCEFSVCVPGYGSRYVCMGLGALVCVCEVLRMHVSVCACVVVCYVSACACVSVCVCVCTPLWPGVTKARNMHHHRPNSRGKSS